MTHHSKDTRDLETILTRLRDLEVNRELHKLSDRVDQHIMLSALDVAEWKQRLAVFLDTRSMGFACGVEDKYSGASLRRLSTVKSDQGGTKLVNLHKLLGIKRQPRQAYLYAINPDFPLVQSFGNARDGKTFPRTLPGDPNLFGDFGVNVPRTWEERMTSITVTDERHSLIEFFRDPDHFGLTDDHFRSTAQGGKVRRGLLIGRTELGVALGKPAVAVYLELDSEWQPYLYIAGRLGLSDSYVYKLLSRMLAPLGLARSDMAEWFGQGTRQVWRIGTPIEECHPDNLPDVVGERLRRWERQRGARKLRYPVTEEEWLAAEISAMAGKVER